MTKISINIKKGSVAREQIIVGIDLGTTNSLVAVNDKETNIPYVLKDSNKTSIVPSVIYFGNDDNIIVGSEARKYLITDAENTIYSVKRLMGKSYKDISDAEETIGYKIIDEGTDSLVKIRIRDKFYSPIDLSSLILKELKLRAEKVLGQTVTKAVITVPAYFNDTQRQATRDAGKLAGMDVLRIINEPTAASLAYGIGSNAEDEKVVAIYDLGGGTFDISILRITKGIFEVLSTNGDTYLGGDDFDRLITEKWYKENALDKKLLSKNILQEIRLRAEEAKKILTFQDTFSDQISRPSAPAIVCNLNKKEFEELISPLVYKTITLFKNALRDAGLPTSEIDTVIMVGGSTRTPFIKKTISEFFNIPITDTLDPDEVVALGAAIQADILAGNNADILLLDVTPLSLGIETMGGLMDTIIPRNSKIPISAGRQYTTSVDGQSKLKISVYQGERDLVSDNRKLSEFILNNIPGMPAGFPKIEITFQLNADGILKVTAKELRSNTGQSIEVKPQYGLTEEQMGQMLIDSISNARQDMQNRTLIEAKVEAQNLLSTCEKFIQQNAGILHAEEIKGSQVIIEKLKSVLNTTDKDLINSYTQELNEYTTPFAERLMDIAISKAMTGKKI